MNTLQSESKVAVLIRKVPAETYRRFKMQCAGEGKTIQAKVIELLESASAGTILGGPDVVLPTKK